MVLRIADIDVCFPPDYFASEYWYPGKENAFTFSGGEDKSEKSIKISRELCDGLVCADHILHNAELIFTGSEPFYPDKLYRYADRYYYVHHDTANRPCLIYSVDDSWTDISVVLDRTGTYGRYAFEYLGKIIPYSFLRFQALIFHGTLLEYGGKGIILAAPSGTGKTTHAHIWRDSYRALILNGDRSLCRKKNGNWTGYGMPWCGSSGEYINREVPVRAIVVLQQWGANEVLRMPAAQGFQIIYENLLLPAWNKQEIDRGLDLFDDMLSKTPVFLLRCRPEKEAADLLKMEIDRL